MGRGTPAQAQGLCMPLPLRGALAIAHAAPLLVATAVCFEDQALLLQRPILCAVMTILLLVLVDTVVVAPVFGVGRPPPRHTEPERKLVRDGEGQASRLRRALSRSAGGVGVGLAVQAGVLFCAIGMSTAATRQLSSLGAAIGVLFVIAYLQLRVSGLPQKAGWLLSLAPLMMVSSEIWRISALPEDELLEHTKHLEGGAASLARILGGALGSASRLVPWSSSSKSRVLLACTEPPPTNPPAHSSFCSRGAAGRRPQVASFLRTLYSGCSRCLAG